jgi:dipeptidyl aminopeptidase/acylaminoacyl peptidase
MRTFFLVLTVLLTSCSLSAPPVATPIATAVLPTATAITPTPLPTPTLAPYEQYTINYLGRRTYGGGKIEIVEKLAESDTFTSYSIRYPSEGLTIYGFMNIPKGNGPFPVIISVHGYAAYGKYDPFNPSQDFADFFAENQFIVIHPGLRNQPPSDNGDNLLRVGMTLDVMNLIALVKAKNDLPTELASADTDLLGLWGMSVGGEIALRVLTISPDIKAAVLYSPLSGNEERNSRQLYEVLRDEQFQKDAQVPLELLDRISPMYYYHQIKSAVQLNHGTKDTTAPISWAVETCDFLESAGVSVQCIYYEKAGHVFSGDNARNLRENALEFYATHLSP